MVYDGTNEIICNGNRFSGIWMSEKVQSGNRMQQTAYLPVPGILLLWEMAALLLIYNITFANFL